MGGSGNKLPRLGGRLLRFPHQVLVQRDQRDTEGAVERKLRGLRSPSSRLRRFATGLAPRRWSLCCGAAAGGGGCRRRQEASRGLQGRKAADEGYAEACGGLLVVVHGVREGTSRCGECSGAFSCWKSTWGGQLTSFPTSMRRIFAPIAVSYCVANDPAGRASWPACSAGWLAGWLAGRHQLGSDLDAGRRKREVTPSELPELGA